jgi:hypothetical protein
MVEESRRETTKSYWGPDFVWIWAYQYLALVNNWTADRTLRWKCPHTKRFGVTPDISALLSFHFYEPVYYLDIVEPTPYSKEKAGYWLGVAHNVGDALTYHILTDDTQQVIQRSVVRSRNDIYGVNKRVSFDPNLDPAVTLHKQNQNVSLPNPVAISSEEIPMERQHKRFRKKRGTRGALTERSTVNGKIQANDGVARMEEDAIREDTEDENMIDEQDDHQENEDETSEENDTAIDPGEEEVYSIRRSGRKTRQPSRFVNAVMLGLQMGKFLYSEPIWNVLTPLQSVPGAHAIILEQDMTTSSFLSRPEVNKLRELYVADLDLWIKKTKDGGYDYIASYDDDIIVISKEPMALIQEFQKTYSLKGIGTPEYYLGGNFLKGRGSSTLGKGNQDGFER